MRQDGKFTTIELPKSRRRIHALPQSRVRDSGWQERLLQILALKNQFCALVPAEHAMCLQLSHRLRSQAIAHPGNWRFAALGGNLYHYPATADGYYHACFPPPESSASVVWSSQSWYRWCGKLFCSILADPVMISGFGLTEAFSCSPLVCWIYFCQFHSWRPKSLQQQGWAWFLSRYRRIWRSGLLPLVGRWTPAPW